jgi:membrane fusion protein (multidrug efflux system)
MRWLLAPLVAVLPALAWAQETWAQDSSPPPSVLVTTAPPQMGSVGRTVTAYGVAQAAPGSSETLSVLRSTQVTQTLVAVGQSVKQGQPILGLSADPAALASYKQAVTALALAQSERARVTQLLNQRLATRDQVAQAEKAASDAQGNLDLLKGAGGGTAGQTLTAPFDGVVSALLAATGARVAAQAPLATLDRADSLIISVGVEPAQRGVVAPGQAARIEPMDGSQERDGRLLAVGGMLDPATRLVPVLLTPATASGLLPGGPVRVVVRVGEASGWLVPREAVATDGKGAFVFQTAGGKASRIDVQVAGTNGGTTVVTGPIDPKRALVTSGNYQLQDGSPVREDQPGAAGVAAR